MCIKRIPDEITSEEAWKLFEKKDEKPEPSEEEKELNELADGFFGDLEDIGKMIKRLSNQSHQTQICLRIKRLSNQKHQLRCHRLRIKRLSNQKHQLMCHQKQFSIKRLNLSLLRKRSSSVPSVSTYVKERQTSAKIAATSAMQSERP